MPTRRAIGLALPAFIAARAARAETAFPDRPVRVVVGFTAGGGTDGAMRAVAPRWGELLGQTVIVDNRAGAGGNIATESVVRAPADGLTLLLGTIGPMVVNPVAGSLSFDPMADLTPVAPLVFQIGILVVPAASPWRDVGALLAEARRRPGSLNWGYSGIGTSGHLAALLMDKLAGIQTVGVAYRGGGPLMTDLVAGRLDYAFSTAPPAMPQIEAGRLRALAVPATRRAPFLPDTPTVEEAGLPGFDVGNVYGILAPRGTPPAAIGRLAATLREALGHDGTIAALRRQGLEPAPGGPEEYAATLRADQERFVPLVRDAGIRVE
ncbi:MAG TPA: tripartite tricarboxylate transporter substrate binding protein [Roseomonas sp.]|jgi:tripartite-type tricarboxylate transporter receptor subunit TctC